MADPLATIDAWGSPSASVSALPPAGNDNGRESAQHTLQGDQTGRGDDHDDDDAPLSTTLQRAKDGYSSGSAAPPVQRTHSSTQQNQQPFLKVRITGLERNRKDLLIRFDANVSTRPCPCRTTAILIQRNLSDQPPQFSNQHVSQHAAILCRVSVICGSFGIRKSSK